MRFFHSVDATKIGAKRDWSPPTRVSTTQLKLRPTVLKSLITHTYTFIPGRTPLYKRSVPRTSQYLHRTQPAYDTNFHAPTRFQTHIPRNQAIAYIRRRLHGYCDRLRDWITSDNISFQKRHCVSFELGQYKVGGHNRRKGRVLCRSWFMFSTSVWLIPVVRRACFSEASGYSLQSR